MININKSILYNIRSMNTMLPININYLYNFGSLIGFFIIIQIITGIFLAMFYIGDIENAFNSIEYIMREVNYGWIIRYIHSNGAWFIFLFTYIHIGRGILYNSYIGKNRYTWFIGIILFLLLIITAFLGYSLVFGMMSLWGATVITNFLTTVPYVGEELIRYIWGGYTIGTPTINRFFAIHYLLPFIIIGLTIIHIIVLHEVGGTNPLGTNTVKDVNIHPYYTLQDILGFLIFILIFIYVIYYKPNYFSHSDNYIEANSLITPEHIVPEMYLLPFYAILRAIPNKLLGIILLLLSILILFILPYIQNIWIKTFRPIYKYGTYIFYMVFILLIWIGESEVVEPYIIIGQILTIMYFGYFIIYIPLFSLIELLIFIL